MATEVIAFPVNLRKNQNQYNSAYGKYYPEADTKEPLSLKGFARHLSEHGKLVDYPMAVLVLQNIVACLKEMAIQGQPVKLDGFGTFTPTIESDGQKAQDTVEKALSVGLENMIAGVHLRFTPENSKGEELTSRKMKSECTFKAAYVVSSKEKTINGKKRTYQEKIPISSFSVATHQEGGE
jgi:nucleoid DNA-binding protein